jgi:hypothetical protein
MHRAGPGVRRPGSRVAEVVVYGSGRDGHYDGCRCGQHEVKQAPAAQPGRPGPRDGDLDDQRLGCWRVVWAGSKRHGAGGSTCTLCPAGPDGNGHTSRPRVSHGGRPDVCQKPWAWERAGSVVVGRAPRGTPDATQVCLVDQAAPGPQHLALLEPKMPLVPVGHVVGRERHSVHRARQYTHPLTCPPSSLTPWVNRSAWRNWQTRWI